MAVAEQYEILRFLADRIAEVCGGILGKIGVTRANITACHEFPAFGKRRRIAQPCESIRKRIATGQPLCAGQGWRQCKIHGEIEIEHPGAENQLEAMRVTGQAVKATGFGQSRIEI